MPASDHTTQTHHLIVYGIIVIPLALAFLFVRRTPNQPVRLNLKPDADPNLPARTPVPHAPPPPRREKVLNVNFNWNGHLFEAYEVLDVPAGSSIESAHAALERALTTADDESARFFRAAYDAILKTY